MCVRGEPTALVYRVLVVALVVAALPNATAHSDIAIEETVTIEPNNMARLPFEAHWHRVMGTVTVVGEGAVDVHILQATGWTGVMGGNPAASHTIDHLIECCRDATWTEHALLVSNFGDEPVEVVVDVRAMHDDFVVAVDRAEGGIVPSAFVIAGIGLAIAWAARRRMDEPLDAAEGKRRLRHTAMAWSVLVVPPTVLALIGMVRYGVGPFAGTVGGLAELPLAPGFFGAVAYFGALVIVLWFVTLYLWGRTVRDWPGARRAVAMTASVGIAGVVALTLVLIVEHGAVFVPALLALAFIAPAAWLVWVHRQATLEKVPVASAHEPSGPA